MPGLGRIPSPADARDHNFALTDELARRGIEELTTGHKLWAVPVVYDQGQTPHCVGYSGAGFLTSRAAEADASAVESFDAEALYAWANGHDGDPTPHDGTTVRAGFQAVVQAGVEVTASNRADQPAGHTEDKLLSYLWASAVDEADANLAAIITWLLTVGPLWVGTTWDNAMFQTDADGFVHATGGEAGGHAWLVRGYDSERAAFAGRTSWGAVMGTVSDTGSGLAIDLGQPASDFFISAADLASLLSAGGECGTCVETAVEVIAGAQPPVSHPGIVTEVIAEVEHVAEEVVHEVEHLVGHDPAAKAGNYGPKDS